MSIDGKVVGLKRASVFEEVAGHPVILARGRDVFYLLAEIAPIKLCSALARRADECDGEAWIIGHRDYSGLPITGETFDANAMRIDSRVGCKIIECATRPPRPCAKRSPVLELSR